MNNKDSCPCPILDKRSWCINVPLTMLFVKAAAQRNLVHPLLELRYGVRTLVLSCGQGHDAWCHKTVP